MPKKGRRTNINFRQTRSDRSATQSYRGFAKFLKGNIRKFIPGK